MKSNKKLIIGISIVFILVITAGVFAFLFLKTDLFKSNQELFMKYISQDIDKLEKNLDFKIVEILEQLENQNKYESNTNIKMIHSEGGEVSNPFNNLTATLDIQKNEEEQYFYADGQILYEEDEYLETEIIKEQDLYGIRFSDAVKQFITVKKDENTEMVASDIGIELEVLEKLINYNSIVSEEQICALKDKCLNIITQELMNGEFQKQKNAVITYKDATTETNAYAVSLSSEQVENLLVQILNNIKNDTEIIEVSQIDEIIEKVQEELELPTIKITVYEEKQKTIRTVMEIGGIKVTIENSEETEGTKTKISYLNLNAEREEKYEIQLNKQNTENNEILLNVINEDENYTISIFSQIQLLSDKNNINIEVEYKQGITTISAILESKIILGSNFEKAQSLASDNNITISSLEQQRRQDIIKLLKELVPQKFNERIQLLKGKLGIIGESVEAELTESEDAEKSENTISQVEINKFNSKFEFYTGNQVSAENVKMLLDVVKNNLKNYEIVDTEDEKLNIKIIVEKDIVNVDAINKILEKINNNNKYKISIFYKDSNGLIEYITISEI